MRKYAAILVIATFMVGCNSDSKSADNGTPTKSQPEVKKADPAVGSTEAPKPPTTPSTASSTDPATSANKDGDVAGVSGGVVTAVVPPELKHAGYEYEGLTNTKPVDMELVASGRPDVITGSQSVTLIGVKDGKATYKIERTGKLSILGSDEVSVEKDGVYTNSSSVAKLSAHAMELPASPKPGDKWNFHVTSDQKDSEMDMETTCKVVGIQKVKTKGGTYDNALLVEQTSKGKLRGKNVRTVSRSWYVKGIGTVKADLTTTNPDGKTESLTIQETHH